MPSSYSTNLKIELQATGENSGTWGTITNTNLGTALEQAVVGYGNPSYASDANLTLTYTDTNAAQAARALVLNVTSAVSLTVTRELVVPTIQKQYIVQNNTTGSQSITVKTSGGTGITVTNGRKAHLYVNGTDVIFMDDFVDINGGAIDGTTIGASSAAAGTFTTLGATTGNITTVNATTVDTTNVEVTNIKAKDGTAAGSIADSTGVVTLGSSVLTTTDINGGTIDGTVIGGAAAAAGTFTTATATTGNITTVNATTVDTTNIEVTNLKAKDGTAAGSIADSTGVVTLASSVLTTTDINGGTIDGTTIGGSSAAAGTFTTLTASGVSTFSAGSAAAPSITTTGDTNTGLFFPAADTIAFTEGGVESMRINSSGNVGIGTASPVGKLDVSGGTSDSQLYLAGRSDSASLVNVSNIYARNQNGSGFDGCRIKFDVSSTSGEMMFHTATGGTLAEKMRLDSSGNLGIGTASPTTRLDVVGVSSVSSNNFKQLVVRNDLDSDRIYMGAVAAAVGSYIQNNAFYDNSFEFKPNDAASEGIHFQDGAIWFSTNSGLTPAVNFTPTERMRLGSSGNLGIGTASPTYKLDVVGSTETFQARFGTATTNFGIFVNDANNFVSCGSITNDDLRFFTNGSDRAIITAAGLLLVGTTTGTSHVIKRDTSDTVLTVLGNGGADSVYINSVNATGANLGAAAAIFAQKNSASGRSISAAGTINASGADYAEYMTKASDFVIAKGDVCGIDANGKLTNVFSNSVSFVVKSTNPSYVGGDTWADKELIGKKPTNKNELAKWYDRAEESRQKVDRIAFSGQVPVNVLGATPGQYIVPINDNGAIKGVAVSNPTFEQYQSAVGKVIAVQDDGRALIIVKVA